MSECNRAAVVGGPHQGERHAIRREERVAVVAYLCSLACTERDIGITKTGDEALYHATRYAAFMEAMDAAQKRIDDATAALEARP